MSVDPGDFRPESDQDPVHHPQLRLMVEAARGQAPPRVSVSADALHAQWTQHRARRRRIVAVSLAAAASLVLLIASPWSTTAEPETALEPSESIAAVDPPREPASNVPPNSASEPTTSEPTTSEPTTAEPARLADAITVRALDGTTGTPEVLGPHRLRLPDGRWSVESQSTGDVEVLAGDQQFELRGGYVHVEVAGDVARVEVLREEVLHLALETEVVDSPTRPAPPSADALAREAEAHLAAGRPNAAIKSLRRLVTHHPGASATPAALIDLGRLLERAGRTDQARCAYAMFLARWPGHPLSGDVERAQRALGEGPRCRGLRPRR